MRHRCAQASDLRAAFGAFGTIAKVVRTASNWSRVLVEYEDAEAAFVAAAALAGTAVGAGALPVHTHVMTHGADSSGTTLDFAALPGDGRTVIVTQLEGVVGDHDLRDAFLGFGDVRHAEVAVDVSTGASLRHGAVAFVSCEAAEGALTASTVLTEASHWHIEVYAGSPSSPPPHASTRANDATTTEPSAPSTTTTSAVVARLPVRCPKCDGLAHLRDPAPFPHWQCDVAGGCESERVLVDEKAATCRSNPPGGPRPSPYKRAAFSPVYTCATACACDWCVCPVCYTKLSDPGNVEGVVAQEKERLVDDAYSRVLALSHEEHLVLPRDTRWLQHLPSKLARCDLLAANNADGNLFADSLQELAAENARLMRSIWPHAGPTLLDKRLQVVNFAYLRLHKMFDTHTPGRTQQSMPPQPGTPRHSACVNTDALEAVAGEERAPSAPRTAPPQVQGLPRAATTPGQGCTNEGVWPAEGAGAQGSGRDPLSVAQRFFIQSGLLAIVQFARDTWNTDGCGGGSDSQPDALSVRMCEDMLQEGAGLLMGIAPMSLAAECQDPASLWCTVLTKASVQLQSLCTPDSAAPQHVQSLVLTLALELAGQTGRADTLVDLVLLLLDAAHAHPHAGALAAAVLAAVTRMRSVVQGPRRAGLTGTSVDVKSTAVPGDVAGDTGAGDHVGRGPDALVSAAGELLSVLLELQPYSGGVGDTPTPVYSHRVDVVSVKMVEDRTGAGADAPAIERQRPVSPSLSPAATPAFSALRVVQIAAHRTCLAVTSSGEWARPPAPLFLLCLGLAREIFCGSRAFLFPSPPPQLLRHALHLAMCKCAEQAGCTASAIIQRCSHRRQILSFSAMHRLRSRARSRGPSPSKSAACPSTRTPWPFPTAGWCILGARANTASWATASRRRAHGESRSPHWRRWTSRTSRAGRCTARPFQGRESCSRGAALRTIVWGMGVDPTA